MARVAAVTVNGEVVGEIGPGLLVLAGFGPDDEESALEWMASRLLGLRIFPDADGRIYGLGDDALVALYHGRYLLALVRVDQEHDLIVPHVVSLRIGAATRPAWRCGREIARTQCLREAAQDNG